MAGKSYTALTSILLPGPPVYSLKLIGEQLGQYWPELGEMAAAEEQVGICSWTHNGLLISVARMARPVPWSDLEGPCATSILWKNAAEEIMLHREHLLVVVMGDVAPVDRAAVLTKVTAGVLLANPAALGVFWAGAALVVPAALFVDFTKELLPLGPPLWIWVDFRAGTNETGATSGFTQGMEALGLMEIETTNASESPGELRERFMALARYLIEHGMVINHGHTVGESSTAERILVEIGPSAFGYANDVMRLNYSPAG